ncbi:MAG: hypothetical protein COB66_01320 [Coxiella sp. (in: Bacteria)]|nr:MAG: hypothetical protein COB66_01320 [Coxiella sp. (in: g-proteobacteria)]
MATNPILSKLGSIAGSAASDIEDETAVDDSALKAAISDAEDALGTTEDEVTSSLKDLEVALAEQTTATAESIEQIETATKESTVASATIEEAMGGIAEANQTIQAVKLNESLKVQNTTIDAFEAAGGSEVQLQLVGELAADSARISDLHDNLIDIVDDEHTGNALLDGIVNQFRSIQTYIELDAANNKAAATSRELTNIQASTETVARTASLTQKTLNEATIAASLKKLASEDAIALSEQQIRNINANSDRVAKIYTMRQGEINTLLQTFRLEGEVQNRALSAERNKLAVEEMAFRREQLPLQREKDTAALALTEAQLAQTTDPLRIAALEAQQATQIKTFNDTILTEKAQVQTVQKAQSVAGIPIEAGSLITAGLKQTGVLGARYDALLLMGTGASPSLGANPWEAKRNLAIVAPTGNFTRTPVTRMLDMIEIKQQAKYAANPAGIPKDEATLKANFNTTAAETAADASQTIISGDTSNPYVAPPMTVLKDVSAIRDTPLFTKVLGPMNLTETNPQKIMDASIAGVRAKVISPEEAANGIQTIFSSAAAINNTMAGGYSRIGFPSQTTYNVPLELPPTAFQTLTGSIGVATSVAAIPFTGIPGLVKGEGFFGGPDKALQALVADRLFTVDLMNKQEVEFAIAKLLATAAPTSTVLKKEGE